MGTEIEIEGAFDGFTVSGEVIGAESFFEWGWFFFGWIGYRLSHAFHL